MSSVYDLEVDEHTIRQRRVSLKIFYLIYSFFPLPVRGLILLPIDFHWSRRALTETAIAYKSERRYCERDAGIERS